MLQSVTDHDLEAVLGAVTGIRGPTYEEEAECLADMLRERAGRRPRSRRVLVSPGLLRYIAGRLEGLAVLAQEGM